MDSLSLSISLSCSGFFLYRARLSFFTPLEQEVDRPFRGEGKNELGTFLAEGWALLASLEKLSNRQPELTHSYIDEENSFFRHLWALYRTGQISLRRIKIQRASALSLVDHHNRDVENVNKRNYTRRRVKLIVKMSIGRRDIRDNLVEGERRPPICSPFSLPLSPSPFAGWLLSSPGKFRRNNVTPAFATARDINDARPYSLCEANYNWIWPRHFMHQTRHARITEFDG